MSFCKDPLEKCCQITPSACVEYTGAFRQDTRFDATCRVSINVLFEQIDEQIVILSNGVEIPVDRLREKDVCNKIDVSSITIRPTNPARPDYVKVNDVVKQLVGIVCDLQSQISIVHDTEKLNKDFFDLELPDDIKSMLGCLQCDDGCDPLYPTTLRSLLKILAMKTVELPCKVCNPTCPTC